MAEAQDYDPKLKYLILRYLGPLNATLDPGGVFMLSS